VCEQDRVSTSRKSPELPGRPATDQQMRWGGRPHAFSVPNSGSFCET
jgi:hypothetical protein